MRAGETVLLPRGIPHGFRVLSGRARMLTITRGGFEAMVRSMSRPATGAVLPEPVEPSVELQARLVAACAANGIEVLGPPIE